MSDAIQPMSDEERRGSARGNPPRDRALWIGGGALAMFAAAFGGAIALRSQAPGSPATSLPRGADANLVAAPAPIYVQGPLPDDTYLYEAQPRYIRPQPSAPATYPTLPGVPRTPRVPNPGYMPGPPIAKAPPQPIIPYVPTPVAPPVAKEPAPPPGSLAGTRALASRLANPATTVPQGAVIPAVLETALDSTRPGFVRAIVSRDVRSFDGTKVLIPRGSRLFGEYKADMASGQKRAFVIWQKLTRPDGVQIALDSPAADALGRSGIKGKVNSHFFERFAGAMLQSALDIGVGLATRSASGDTLLLGLPGSTTQINPAGTESIKPTLKTPQGSVVSVFVARDLDFASVG